MIGTVVLAAAVAVILRLLGASQHNLIAGVAGVVFASLIWLPVTRRWSARAHLCWASSVFLFVVFLIYALEWTLDSHLGAREHGRRSAALAARGLRRRAVLRVPVGDLRRARHRALGAADHADHQAVRPRQRTAHGQPARPGAQRAAGDGHRHAALAAAARLSALRDHPDRRQHRRRGAMAPGGGLVRAARGQVRPPGRLAGLQVRGAELRAAQADLAGGRGHRHRRLGLPGRARLAAPVRARVRRSVDRLRPVAAGLPRLAQRPATTGGSTTPTSTSSPSRNPPATSTTGPSSPARWA